MKNKFLLLFLFILPSLGFAQSVSLIFALEKPKNLIQISAVTSIDISEYWGDEMKKDSGMVSTSQILKTDNDGFIWKDDNEEAIVKMRRVFSLMLSEKTYRRTVERVFSQTRWQSEVLYANIQVAFIEDGYALTHKETSFREDKDKHELYYFKPEKP